MRKLIFLFFCLLIIFSLGCIDNDDKILYERTEPEHTIQRYVEMTWEGNNVFWLSIESTALQEKISGTHKRIMYEGFLKDIDFENSVVSLSDENMIIHCVETESLNIFCFKSPIEAKDYLRGGIGFDRNLPENSVVEYIGVKMRDSVETDCFTMIPDEDYINKIIVDMGMAYGPIKRAAFETCYGIEDGLLRRFEGELIFQSKLMREEILVNVDTRVNWVGYSKEEDIEMHVPFAEGDITCGVEHIEIELISLSKTPIDVNFDSIVIENKTVTLNNFFEIETGIHPIIDIDIYAYIFFEKFPVALACEEISDFCHIVICDNM